MQANCKIEDHFNSPVIALCANPNCDKNRFLCINCICSIHNTCFNFLLHIDSVLKKDLLVNKNWIQNQKLREAIINIEKHKLNNSDNIFNAFKTQLERECDSLIQSFTQEVTKSKDQFLARLKEMTNFTDINVAEFMNTFRNIYNFDSLVAILQEGQQGVHNLENRSQRLEAFFKKCATDAEQNIQLGQAENLNSRIKSYSKIFNKEHFDKFKNSIPFNTFLDYSFPWTWDPAKKSNRLKLSENNTLVQNVSLTGRNYYGILGKYPMTKGRYKWGIEIGNINTDWICFGVIEPSIVTNLELFPFLSSIGFSLANQRYNMIGNETLSDYKSKIFTCDLNLTEGTFQISCEQVVLATQKDNLKNKTLSPFIILYSAGNCAKLHIYNEF